MLFRHNETPITENVRKYAAERGVTLTAEGKLFPEEVRVLLKRDNESVEKIRALATPATDIIGTSETYFQTWDFRSWIAPWWPRPESRPNVQRESRP